MVGEVVGVTVVDEIESVFGTEECGAADEPEGEVVDSVGTPPRVVVNDILEKKEKKEETQREWPLG